MVDVKTYPIYQKFGLINPYPIIHIFQSFVFWGFAISALTSLFLVRLGG